MNAREKPQGRAGKALGKQKKNSCPYSNTPITQSTPGNRRLSRNADRAKLQRESDREKELQLELIPAKQLQPEAKHQPKEPLIVTSEKTAHHWPRKRYRLTCAYTGESMGVPLYGDEVERILSKFKGRRSPVTKTEIWKTLEAISKDKRQQIREVAA